MSRFVPTEFGIARTVVAVLTAAAVLLPCGGCGKSEQEKAAAGRVAKTEYNVTEKDKTDAGKAVREAWDAVRSDVRNRFHPSDRDRSFYLDLATLTRNKHRLAGFPNGSVAASDFVANRLRDMGVPQVFVQRFPVIQTVTRQCRLVVDGKSYDIHAMRPNLLNAAVTPAEGLSGETIYVGHGEVSEYGNQLAEGKIVVLDSDSERNWESAFAFGARAVLFVGSDAPVPVAYHHTNLPANLPRFYVPAELAERLQLNRKGTSRRVEIFAACEWREMEAQNVIGFIPGTNPKAKKDKPQAEALVLAVPLDSLSEVPELSPGARDAANCAALLQVAEFLLTKENRPKRDTILCFFDGQSQNHLGARAFYGALFRQENKDAKSVAERLTMFESELEYCRKIHDLLGLENLFAPENETRECYKSALRMLRDEARGLGSEVIQELHPLRIRIRKLDSGRNQRKTSLNQIEERRKQAGPAEAERLEEQAERLRREIDDLQKQKEELEPQIFILDAEDLALNSVQRIIHEKSDPKDPAVLQELFPTEEDAERRKLRDRLIEITPDRFERIIEHSKEICTRRVRELKRKIERGEQDFSLFSFLGPDQKTILLHVSINLGDARKQWTFIHGEDSVPLAEDTIANYSMVLRTMREVYWDTLVLKDKKTYLGRKQGESAGRIEFETADGKSESVDTRDVQSFTKGIYELLPNFDDRPLKQSYDIRLFAPGKCVDSGAIARMTAKLNVSVITVFDPLSRQGQPCDTLAALNGEVMLDQVRQIAPFIKSFSDRPNLGFSSKTRPTVAYFEGDWSDGKSRGPAVRCAGAGSAMSDQPVRDAIVAVIGGGSWSKVEMAVVPPGFVYPLIVKTDTNGIFELPACSQGNYEITILFAAAFDGGASQRGDDSTDEASRGRGIPTSVSTTATLSAGTGLTTTAVKLFSTRSKTVVGYGFDRGAIATIAMRSLSAKFRNEHFLLCELGSILTLFAPEDAEKMKLFNKNGLVILNNQDTTDDYKGKGISLDDGFDHPVTPVYAAHDSQILNNHRLTNLRKVGISQPSLEEHNSEAHATYQDAIANASLRSADWYYGSLEASAAYSRRVYGPLVGVMNDLVTAVVLLLLLAMPFAYALERLLIGTPHIYRQIGWFSLFFLITFGVLYVVNPAFKIASTPMIIFLAFAIILLSSLVIFILIRKLQTEVRKMQGLATTVHSADVSRLSTMMAAVNMGISTMRRRPLRTFLTGATVVLLTFTILTFASFGSSWGTARTYQGPLNGNERIMVRQPLWGAIGDGVFRTLRGYFEGKALVVPRYWMSPTATQARDAIAANATTDVLVSDASTKQIVPIAAAIGMDIIDLQKEQRLRDVFEGNVDLLARGKNGIFLTDAVRGELGLSEKDIGKATVLLAGRPLIYAGVFADRADAYTSLEGSSILPVDYQASGGESLDVFTAQDTSTLEAAEIESAQFVKYNLDRVVVVSAQTARNMGAKIRSMSIYPADTKEIHGIAERAATVSALPTYVGHRGAVHRLIFTTLAKASGWRDLLIPVVLGGLIIFATMLGSVSDREKEIYTFSSLGLAPPHVASLFFAEASMYAVIGGMGGYLLGQIVARLLGLLSGWINVPTMNYSSTNAIVTIMIVMCTVLLSTVYPAIKASRSANPGIQRSWKIPKPEGNLYDLLFPFTVSAYDITGVVSFLKEHFDNYSDTSLGTFASLESRVFRQKENDMLGFRAKVALTPFDLGVTQEFALLSKPSEIKGIDEVQILIHRLSGAQGDWQRSNRVFINDLRKQLLIWRSLTHEIMDRYREKTLSVWDQLPREQVDGTSIGGQA